MNMKLPWGGRRRFMRISATAMLAIATKSLYAAGDATGVRAPLRSARRLVDGFEHTERAAVVGRAYLAEAPREAHVRVLMRKLQKDDARLRTTLRSGDDDDLRLLLVQRIREDFHDGRVVLVRGWVLSRTEARIYGLAALLHS